MAAILVNHWRRNMKMETIITFVFFFLFFYYPFIAFLFLIFVLLLTIRKWNYNYPLIGKSFGLNILFRCKLQFSNWAISVLVYKRQIATYSLLNCASWRQKLPAYEHFLHPSPLEKYKSHVGNLLHMSSHYLVGRNFLCQIYTLCKL